MENDITHGLGSRIGVFLEGNKMDLRLYHVDEAYK